MWRGGIEDEDDAVGTFLNRSPALLVAPIARYVPEFNVNFSEDAGRRGSVLLILNNPTHTNEFMVTNLKLWDLNLPALSLLLRLT